MPLRIACVAKSSDRSSVEYILSVQSFDRFIEVGSPSSSFSWCFLRTWSSSSWHSLTFCFAPLRCLFLFSLCQEKGDGERDWLESADNQSVFCRVGHLAVIFLSCKTVLQESVFFWSSVGSGNKRSPSPTTKKRQHPRQEERRH